MTPLKEFTKGFVGAATAVLAVVAVHHDCLAVSLPAAIFLVYAVGVLVRKWT